MQRGLCQLYTERVGAEGPPGAVPLRPCPASTWQEGAGSGVQQGTQSAAWGLQERGRTRSPTWLGERHHTGEVAPGWPQWAAERTGSDESTRSRNWIWGPQIRPGATVLCTPVKPGCSPSPAPRHQGKAERPARGRGHPPEDVLAERREGVLLIVPKNFKYNRLALDVLDEGLGHLHSNLREKEHATALPGLERDAMR